MTYLIWKLVHVISVDLFLGNIITGLFWAAQAHRSRDPRLIAATFEGIIRSDRWFTIPGVIGIVVAGMAGAINGRIPILGTGWIFWSIVLFSISGVLFAGWVAPLQRRIHDIAGDAAGFEKKWSTYATLYRRWEVSGFERPFFYYRGDQLAACRLGWFKLHFSTQDGYSPSAPEQHDPPWLFDLGRDPGERFDVAAAHPDVVERIPAAARTHRATMRMGAPQFD